MKLATASWTAAVPDGSWNTYQSTSGKATTREAVASLVASSHSSAASRATLVAKWSRPCASPKKAMTGIFKRGGPVGGSYVSSSAKSALMTGR
eukprot:scaffold74035_cov32-Tisochrysis_lutea.AAC.1